MEDPYLLGAAIVRFHDGFGAVPSTVTALWLDVSRNWEAYGFQQVEHPNGVFLKA
jgi:hypothetical protein